MVLEGVKGKVTDKILDKVFDMLENIDLFDQLADMIKTVVPLKAEITVKGKKTLEIKLHGIKHSQLWISIRRIHEEKPAEEVEEANE